MRESYGHFKEADEVVVCVEQPMQEVVKEITEIEIRVSGGCRVPEGRRTTTLNLHQMQ